MTQFAGLAVLVALAIPADASHPPITRKEKSPSTQSAEPPLAAPLPIPPSAPTTTIGDRVLKVVVRPDRAVANLVLNRHDSDLYVLRLVLEGSPLDLAEAREEAHRFWMGNQPSVLSYERVKGADGP